MSPRILITILCNIIHSILNIKNKNMCLVLVYCGMEFVYYIVGIFNLKKIYYKIFVKIFWSDPSGRVLYKREDGTMSIHMKSSVIYVSDVTLLYVKYRQAINLIPSQVKKKNKYTYTFSISKTHELITSGGMSGGESKGEIVMGLGQVRYQVYIIVIGTSS